MSGVRGLVTTSGVRIVGVRIWACKLSTLLLNVV
uniref:Uncharacterized protein n=1 Tax=Rhizophora mucronata TaxID=61149 RepID=A0A2P2NE78_RHIMU